jgi:hypothetical protein
MKASVFLVVCPEHNYRGEVIQINVDRLTKTNPKLRPNEIAIRLTLDIEKNVFEQFLPDVTIRLDDPRQFATPTVDVVPPPEPDEDTEDPSE